MIWRNSSQLSFSLVRLILVLCVTEIREDYLLQMLSDQSESQDAETFKKVTTVHNEYYQCDEST